MENYAIEQNSSDELQHWGIKGQKWGHRRYQNKDGSLTPAGQKRYNKEVDRLKKEKAKVKAEEKVLANKKKTQAKIDKLEADKKALDDRKKALKEEQSGNIKPDNKGKKTPTSEETFEQRREKALKTSDPNELYKNRDTLSDMELRDRINRINMERQLAQTAASTQKTGMDRINKALEYAKKADEVYKFATGSQAGKDLMKKIGLKVNEEKSYKWKNIDDFYENMDKLSFEDLKKGQERVNLMSKTHDVKNKFDKYKEKQKEEADKAQKKAEDKLNKAKEKAKKEEQEKEYQKQVDDYNERWQKNGAEDTVTSRGVDKGNSRDTVNPKGLSGPTADRETFTGEVEGEGKSRSSIKESWEKSSKTSTKSDDYYDPIDSYGDWMNGTATSNVPAVVTRRGEDVVYGLLEDKYR